MTTTGVNTELYSATDRFTNRFEALFIDQHGDFIYLTCYLPKFTFIDQAYCGGFGEFFWVVNIDYRVYCLGGGTRRALLIIGQIVLRNYSSSTVGRG